MKVLSVKAELYRPRPAAAPKLEEQRQAQAGGLWGRNGPDQAKPMRALISIYGAAKRAGHMRTAPNISKNSEAETAPGARASTVWQGQVSTAETEFLARGLCQPAANWG